MRIISIKVWFLDIYLVSRKQAELKWLNENLQKLIEMELLRKINFKVAQWDLIKTQDLSNQWLSGRMVKMEQYILGSQLSLH